MAEQKQRSRRITKQVVDALKPGQLVWDEGKGSVSGFGVRCQRNRNRKTYVFKKRIAGRQRWFTIGRHGSPFSPDEAREKARAIAGQIADGVDVAAIREEKKNRINVAQLCDDYLADAEQGNIIPRSGEPKKTSTLEIDRGRIKRHIKPLLGNLMVASVTLEDIEEFQNSVASGATAKIIKHDHGHNSVITGGRGTASRTTGLLGGIFAYAVKKRLRPDNPTRGITRFRDKSVDRFLSPQELTKLGDALTKAQDGNPYAVAAIRLLALTGCRKGEILSLRWSYVDFGRSRLALPDSKTGAKAVPLGAPALELLSTIPKIDGNPFVFPGRKQGAHIVDLFDVWKRARESAGIPDIRLHDLRHGFASVGASGGESLYIIGSLLGHQDATTTKRYSHLHDDPRKAAADRIASKIDAAMRGDEAEVVDLSNSKV